MVERGLMGWNEIGMKRLMRDAVRITEYGFALLTGM